MIESIFETCVYMLYALGNVTGLGYEAVNVIIFVLLIPAVFMVMGFRIHYLEKQLPEARNTMKMLPPLIWLVAAFVLLMTYMAIASMGGE